MDASVVARYLLKTLTAAIFVLCAGDVSLAEKQSKSRFNIIFEALLPEGVPTDPQLPILMIIRNGTLVSEMLQTLGDEQLKKSFETLAKQNQKDKHIKIYISQVSSQVSATRLQEVILQLAKHTPKDFQLTIYVKIRRDSPPDEKMK